MQNVNNSSDRLQRNKIYYDNVQRRIHILTKFPWKFIPNAICKATLIRYINFAIAEIKFCSESSILYLTERTYYTYIHKKYIWNKLICSTSQIWYFFTDIALRRSSKDVVPFPVVSNCQSNRQIIKISTTRLPRVPINLCYGCAI